MTGDELIAAIEERLAVPVPDPIPDDRAGRLPQSHIEIVNGWVGEWRSERRLLRESLLRLKQAREAKAG